MSKNKITGIIGFAAIFLVAVFPIPTLAKTVISALIIIGVLYINRAFYYFIQGNKTLMKKKDEGLEKVWGLYKKSYKAKLDFKYRVTMGNIIALKGDAEFAKEVLDSVIDNCKDTQLVNKAKVQKSMTLERLGDIEGAINLLKQLLEKGYKDRPLCINLSSYLIYTNKIKEAKKILKDNEEYCKSSTGLLDNKGWISIIENDWNSAIEIYEDIMDREPKFPDPYIHYAQVKLHFGKKEEAIILLEKSLEKVWSKVTFFKKEITKEMLDKLKTDENNFYLACINESLIKVSKGESFDMLEKEKATTILDKGFDSIPKELVDSINENNEDAILNTEILDEDEILPNTELTEDDLKWEEEHK